MKKKALFICLMLGVAVFFNVLCPQLCASDLLGLDSTQDGRCSVSSHALVYVGASPWILFTLPLIGVFLFENITFIPTEFVLSLFRPPRFFS